MPSRRSDTTLPYNGFVCGEWEPLWEKAKSQSTATLRQSDTMTIMSDAAVLGDRDVSVKPTQIS